ncbi:RNA-directed DNA polymerase, eukaryota, reverse transcriptase zinc-binding domain protein [Tanacetum coccineum]
MPILRRFNREFRRMGTNTKTANHEETQSRRILFMMPSKEAVISEYKRMRSYPEQEFISSEQSNLGLHIDGEDNGASEVPETIFENSDDMKEEAVWRDPFVDVKDNRNSDGAKTNSTDYRNNSKGSVTNFKEELRILDELIDKGNGSDEIVNNRLEILGSILVNRSPTEEFQFYKGLKQGDPLSPFLFILVMESLHISFQRVVDVGMFTGIKLSSSLNISHLFYADDAIFLGQWNDSNIDTLVHVMECFYRDRIKSSASKLGCLVLNTPFLYLGSTPIFHMSIYKVPSSVLHLLESIRSHFFHGHDPRSKKASWVNWNKVLTAKERGGLGVSSLYALNRGLMCKWVWRFFAHKSLLWSRVIKAIHGPEGGLITDVRRGFRSTWTSIVQEVKKLQNQGVNIFDYIRIKIGNGDNTSFWKDKWHNEGVLKDVFPRLYALERHQNVTIHTKLIDYSLVNSFRRNPRSGVEEFQLDNLSRLVSTITLSSAVDRYVWSLENSGEFSVKSIRQVIDANCFPVIHSATRWVKSVPLKVNIMAWKIKMDGLPTRMNISRRGIEIDSIVCPICNSGAESSCHIFFQCNLVRQLARKISSWWNVDYVDVSSYEEWYTWLVSLRLQANLKAVFEGIFYCLWWSVWMFRNKILFEKDTPSQARIFDNIVSNSYYWCKFRCKASFKWIDWLKNSYLVIV